MQNRQAMNTFALTIWTSYSLTTISMANIHNFNASRIQSRSQVKKETPLPFPTLLWAHRWLSPCLTPVLPDIGTSASFVLCTPLRSDDFSRVLPSSLFWLVYDLACLVFLPCHQLPARQQQVKLPFGVRSKHENSQCCFWRCKETGVPACASYSWGRNIRWSWKKRRRESNVYFELLKGLLTMNKKRRERP